MNSTEIFDQYRPLFFSIAYRMLGNVADTEDMIQEAYLKWVEKGKPVVESPKSYFATIITRLCIDHLKSAKVKREEYIGPWLPEPLVDDETSALAILERSESISIAFLAVLENLSPTERAVFLLRQVFDYDYREIAQIVGRSEENCRQLFSRATKNISKNRPRFRASKQQHELLLRQFIKAYSSGDLEGLLSLLAPESVLVADGGGKVAAALQPINTPHEIAQFLLKVHREAFEATTPTFTQVNGQLSLIIFKGTIAQTLITIESNEKQIETIYILRNPDKLKGFNKKRTS